MTEPRGRQVLSSRKGSSSKYQPLREQTSSRDPCFARAIESVSQQLFGSKMGGCRGGLRGEET